MLRAYKEMASAWLAYGLADRLRWLKKTEGYEGLLTRDLQRYIDAHYNNSVCNSSHFVEPK